VDVPAEGFRAQTKRDLDPSAAQRLRDRELTGRAEGIAPRRCEHVDAEGRNICARGHRDEQRRCAPCPQRGRCGKQVIEHRDVPEPLLLSCRPKRIELGKRPTPHAWPNTDSHVRTLAPEPDSCLDHEGEQGNEGCSPYVRDRLSGFDGDVQPREPRVASFPTRHEGIGSTSSGQGAAR